MILSTSSGNFIVKCGVDIMDLSSLWEGHPMSQLYEVCVSIKRYLIMIDFEPFSSLKVVSRWTYSMVLTASPMRHINYSGNGSI